MSKFDIIDKAVRAEMDEFIKPYKGLIDKAPAPFGQLIEEAFLSGVLAGLNFATGTMGVKK